MDFSEKLIVAQTVQCIQIIIFKRLAYESTMYDQIDSLTM